MEPRFSRETRRGEVNLVSSVIERLHVGLPVDCVAWCDCDGGVLLWRLRFLQVVTASLFVACFGGQCGEPKH